MNNKQSNLGLPIEYQKLPQYFDAHNINERTNATNALVEKLLHEQNVKTVLDLTCGTGSQVFYLSERGYDVIGSDFSPALIESARNKAKRKHTNISFLKGDMRTVKVGKFDAVITIFNAIGHVTEADFERTLKNIRDNLKDDGTYIFDIFNLQAITDDVIKDFITDIKSTVNGVTFHNHQYSEIEREKGLLISHDQYTIIKPNAKLETHSNSFSLKIYTSQELQHLLNKNGFKVLNQYDMDGHAFDPDRSLNSLTVAKKRC